MKHILLPLIFLVIISFCVSCTTSPKTTHELTADERARIDSVLVADVPPGAPGLAIGIVSQGNIIYENYAGYANLADSLKLGPDSRFNIASNGKQFTALAVAQLVHHHELNQTDDIRTFFSEFLSDIESPITISHLLTHSSGIRDVYSLWSLQGKTWWQISSDNQDVLDLLMEQDDLNFEPGSQYMYSNSNYILLAEIIRTVEEESFRKTTDKLFTDLNMPSTSFESDYTDIRGPVARPYFNFDTWSTYDWISNVIGDGALFSTLPDQLRWESIIQTQESYPISADVVETSQSLVTGSPIDSYGYGLEHDNYKGYNLLYHEGSTGAWKAVTYRIPEEELSVVVLTNSGKVLPAHTINAVTDILLEVADNESAYKTEPDSPGDNISAEELLGTYMMDGSGTMFEFIESDDELYLRRSGRNDIKLVREASNIFHQWNDPAFKQEFTINGDGESQVTAYYTTHAPYTLTKISADLSDTQPGDYAGIFINDETGAEITIGHLSEFDFRVSITQGNSYDAVLLTPNLMITGSYQITFPDQQTGNVDRFLLDGNRIKDVEFVRVSDTD